MFVSPEFTGSGTEVTPLLSTVPEGLVTVCWIDSVAGTFDRFVSDTDTATVSVAPTWVKAGGTSATVSGTATVVSMVKVAGRSSTRIPEGASRARRTTLNVHGNRA